jgi:hypothetical protein
MEEKRSPLGPGYTKGIKLGGKCCNEAHFRMVLPLYIEDILQDKEIVSEMPWGGGNSITLTKKLPEALEDDITLMCKDMSNTYYINYAHDAEHVLKMFEMDVYEGRVYSENILKRERYAKRCYNLDIYWQADGVSLSYPQVMGMMSLLRRQISANFKMYKPKNYKPGRREIVNVMKMHTPWNDNLPF